MNKPANKRSHLYLNNERKAASKFRIYGGPIAKKPNAPDNEDEFEVDGEESIELSPAEISEQQRRLRANVSQLRQDQSSRYQSRNQTISASITHIDYVIVHFQQTFTKQLKTKFEREFGLQARVYFNLNRSITFSVQNKELLTHFLSEVDKYSQDGKVLGELPPMSVDIFPNMNGFELLTTERMLTSGVTLNDDFIKETLVLELLAEKDNVHQQEIRNSLLSYLQTSSVSTQYYSASEVIEVAGISPEELLIALNNFDVVHRVQQTRTIKISPGELGTVKRINPISLTADPDATIVGIIDTGVFNGTGLDSVLVKPGYCLDLSSTALTDNEGHGTAVAGLVAIGEQMFSNATVFKSRARILPIKVIDKSGDSCSPDKIAEAILEAYSKHGVRLFTLCLNHAIQPYNKAPSVYAYILDELAWKHDILIFISTGNLDAPDIDYVSKGYSLSSSYPNYFSSVGAIDKNLPCENTNLLTPAEALNHISIGAIAHNFINPAPTSGLTPASEYPAIYTRKSHYDYGRMVNGKKFSKTQANKQLHKPDLVYPGGDLAPSSTGPVADTTGLEVLTNDAAKPFIRRAGTSFATPLVASLAAEVLQMYPTLSTQTVKALLINSSRSPIRSTSPPAFRAHTKNELLERLIGRGKPDIEHALFSDENKVTFIIEESIKPEEFKYIELILPDYWLKKAVRKNYKLQFTATLCYKFPPQRDNHLHYCPLHISFALLRSPTDRKPAEDKRSEADWIANVQKNNYDINGKPWSTEVKAINNGLISNTQKMGFNLQHSYFMDEEDNITSTAVCLAVRSRVKTDADDLVRIMLAKPNDFSLVVTLEEIPVNRSIERTGQLYDELIAFNNAEEIAELGNSELLSDVDINI